MNDPKHFRKLNSEVLERLAAEWAKRYPVIRKVLLFRSDKRSLHRYALVVMVSEITDPKDTMYQNYREFLEWSFGGESCSHIQEDLASAYMNDLQYLPHEWIWFMELSDSLPTDFIVPEFSWVLYDSATQAHDEDKGTIPVKLTDQWQNEIAEDAIRYQYIALDNLMWILAKEEEYTALIPELWKKYQCDCRGPKTPKTGTGWDRFFAWETLLCRWAFGEVKAVSAGLREGMPYLPLHSFDRETGSYDEYDIKVRRGVAHVKLDDIRKYFSGIIDIPLPTRLFPDERKEDAKQFSTETINLIREAKPEIETVYNAMKKNVGFSGRIPNLEIRLQEEVRKVLTSQKNDFKVIQSKYFDDETIFILNPSQEKRDFVGALLKEIVKGQAGETVGGQKLYDQYKII